MFVTGLATELLLDRYAMPASRYPHCSLARHEEGIFSEYKAMLNDIGDHRGSEFGKKILPHCQFLVASVGHRMAYEAALDAGVPSYLLQLYEIGVMKLDAAWYSEHAEISRRRQTEMEEKAIDEALEHFESDIESLGAAPYVTSSIISDERWDSFLNGLEMFHGNANPDLTAVGVQTLPRTEQLFERSRL